MGRYKPFTHSFALLPVQLSRYKADFVVDKMLFIWFKSNNILGDLTIVGSVSSLCENSSEFIIILSWIYSKCANSGHYLVIWLTISLNFKLEFLLEFLELSKLRVILGLSVANAYIYKRHISHLPITFQDEHSQGKKLG